MFAAVFERRPLESRRCAARFLPAAARARADKSHDNSFSRDWGETLADAFNARIDLVGEAEVENDDMILAMMDQPLERGAEIGATASRQAALKH